MANSNVAAPKGFVPVRHTDGSPWNGQTEAFLVDSGDNTAIFIGDPVKLAGSSGVAGQVVAGQNVEGMMTVQVDTSGTSGQSFVGVVVGFSPDPTNLMQKHRAASTSRIAYVVTDLTVVYEIQEDADTTPIPGTAIGLNATYTTTSGNTTTGVSKNALDSSAVNTTNTFPLKLIGLSRRVGNSLNTAGSLLDFATFDVIWNTGLRMQNVVGVA
jgi:hypothetical protein